MKDDIFNIDDSDVNSKASHLSEDEINSPEFDPEDFAPAPDKSEDNKNDDGARGRRAAMIFAVIAAVFTLIIAAIGALGNEKIQNSDSDVRRDKVLAAFENCSYARYYSTVEDCDIYAVIYKDKLAGYGVYKTVGGFGGDIEVLVCFDSANAVSAVKIIGENESDGLGDKIKNKGFLSKFVGLNSENASDIGEIDLISGATVSSSAVRSAVNDVMKLGISSFAIAKDMNIETISQSEIDSDIDKDKDPDETSDKDKTDETTRYVPEVTTGPEDSSKLDGEAGGAGNNNNGDDDMSVDVSDVTTVYETEGEDTTAEEEDVTTAADDTKVTTAPVTTTAEPVTTEPPASSEPEDTEPEDSTDDEGGDEDTREPVDNSQSDINQ